MFEEVKEMIDSTIYPNGRGEVTAQNINLAMHGMVEASEEKIEAVETNVADVTNRVAELEQNGGSGNAGGSGALKVWIEDAENGIFLTEEQKAENVATYNVLIEGEHVPVIVCSKYEMSEEGFSISQTTTQSVSYVALKYGVSGENTEAVMFFLGDDTENGFTLYSDGTIELTEEPSTPASRGPLTFYVGYLTTLSAEERITAEQKEHNAKMFEIYKSSPYALGVFLDKSEMFTASMGMSGRAIKTSAHYQAQYFPVETGAEAIFLKEKLTNNDEIGVVILPDGSVYLANELE